MFLGSIGVNRRESAVPYLGGMRSFASGAFPLYYQHGGDCASFAEKCELPRPAEDLPLGLVKMRLEQVFDFQPRDLSGCYQSLDRAGIMFDFHNVIPAPKRTAPTCPMRARMQ